MIFVTVGTQLPFGRLIDAMDNLAADLKECVVAQTLKHTPCNRIEVIETLVEERFEQRCAEARCLVGHAGVGTYLAACRHRKPVILMPRRRDFGEHRSDHQMATAEVLASRPGVQIVHDADDLRRALARATSPAIHAPRGYETLLSELASLMA